MPPSFRDAEFVSPSVILSNVNFCPAPIVKVMALPSTVVPESRVIFGTPSNLVKSMLWC